MAVFRAFKPEAMNKIAKAMGYTGDMGQFQSFIEQDPMRQQQMQRFTNAAIQMAKGGVVKMQTGGMPTYVNPITPKPTADMPFGPAGAAVMQYGYNPTTNQYSISGGGGQQFPEGFESSMNYEDLYRKYPNIRGAFEQGVPKSINPPKGFADEQAMMQRSTGLEQMLPPDYYLPGAYPPGTPMSEREINPKYRETPDPVGFGTARPPGSVHSRFSRQPITKPAANTGTVAQGLTPAVNVGGLQVAPGFSGIPQITPRPSGEPIASQASYSPGPTVPNPALRQAYVPTQEFKKVTKPKMDQNQFLADGTTPNPNYMKPITDPDGNVVTEEVAPTISDVSAQMMQTPGLPTGATVTAQGTTIDPRQEIAATSGQVSGNIAVPTAQATTTTAQGPIESQTNVMQAAQAAPAVDTALQATQAAQGTVDPRAQVTAAQQTATSVGDVNAAQGNAILIDNPVQRQIQQGELISGAADAQTAAQFTEQIQAAEATPSKQATVQGQLEGLLQQFEGGNTPSWAAGAMRSATQAMAARGLGASSIAGQAIIQAAMESALPVAQADASIFAQFEQQNLSNRQQRTMLAAQQRAQFMGQEFDQAFQARVANAGRIADVANMNFTAEQQVQLENSRIANSMNMANLTNTQAVTMAEAAALANMDMANLSNRQQSAVMNAQNFMQMDMANLSNQQQTDIFKAQQRIQSLFTDQAAQNAAAQFNASSANQTDQFFANLANNVSQFNASQMNAQAQYNAGQRNTVERFNAELNNQRDQFNAQNRLVIDQSNAQWRRQIATADTAAINRANELNASALLNISNTAYANMWQYYADSMEWAWTSTENERSRVVELARAKLAADSNANIAALQNDYNSSLGFGSLIGSFLTAGSGSVAGKLLGSFGL